LSDIIPPKTGYHIGYFEGWPHRAPV
jgi:hypothetical protein